MRGDEGLTLDLLLHAIASGGFINADEEHLFRKDFPDVDVNNFDSLKELKENNKIARRLFAVRKMWNKIEKELVLFKHEKQDKLADPEVIMERLFEINKATFEWSKFFKLFAEKEEEEEEEEEEGNKRVAKEIKVDAKFSPAQLLAGKKEVKFIEAIAFNGELMKNRACLHLALADIALKKENNVLSYDISTDFGNDGIDNQLDGHWKCEGSLLPVLTKASVKKRREEFREKLEELSKKLYAKRNQHGVLVDDISGKCNLTSRMIDGSTFDITSILIYNNRKHYSRLFQTCLLSSQHTTTWPFLKRLEHPLSLKTGKWPMKTPRWKDKTPERKLPRQMTMTRTRNVQNS